MTTDNWEFIQELAHRRQRLIDKFGRTPRVYNRAEWQQLLSDYRFHDLPSNAANVEARIGAYESILRNEHTPIGETDTAGPWQLIDEGDPAWMSRADIEA